MPALGSEIAIIDIGSNAVRLVIFDAADIAPIKRHIERTMCGLGEDMVQTKRLSIEGAGEAIKVLKHFSDVIKSRHVQRVRAIATAAVRDAEDGPAFISRAKAETGIDITVLSGAEEARISALGVIAAMAGQDGLIGDFGGGSLELVLVKNGQAQDGVSLPIGSQRLLAIADPKERKRVIRQHLRSVPALDKAAAIPFYAVGGAWRAFGKKHMEDTRHPVQILDQYAVRQSQAISFAEKIISGQENLAATSGDISIGAEVLIEIMKHAQSQQVSFSASGLREGLLVDMLSDEDRERSALVLSACKIAGFFGHMPDGLTQLEKAAYVLIPWARKIKDPQALLHDVSHAPLVRISHAERAFLTAVVMTACGHELPRHPLFSLIGTSDLQRAAKTGQKLKKL
jgi:exopolyphosphatase/guanosine-5'-triphosphate,3'-diphosphate pyrophosphatase